MNIASRIKDRQINRFTRYREVKKILEERFLRANGKPSWNVSSLWGPPATASEIRVLKTELPLNG